jgi:hypothetical protein
LIYGGFFEEKRLQTEMEANPSILWRAPLPNSEEKGEGEVHQRCNRETRIDSAGRKGGTIDMHKMIKIDAEYTNEDASSWNETIGWISEKRSCSLSLSQSINLSIYLYMY